MNMNTLKKAALAILFLLAFSGVSHAQAVLTQTTLSSAVGGGGQGTGYSGINSSAQSFVVLASTTNVTAATNGTPSVFLYIDTELMGVTTVNTTTGVVGVERGVGGTKETAHASGDMVLIGTAGTTSQFAAADPDGACLSTAIISTPYINVLNGNQWLCSSITGTWVPGFRNNSGKPKANTTLVADAAGVVLPSGPLFELGGATNAITGFTIPVGCDATPEGGCQFTVFPTTAWTWTTAGNINVAGTAVAFHAIIFTWDATTSKFEPLQGK
jgi:hypothetical protein